jgi:hypothetical protein
MFRSFFTTIFKGSSAVLCAVTITPADLHSLSLYYTVCGRMCMSSVRVWCSCLLVICLWTRELMYVCLISNFYWDTAVLVSNHNSLGFCLWGWMKSEVYKRRVDTWDELQHRILDAAASIKKGDVQLRRTARDLSARVVKFVEADSGIFENLLWTVANLSFLCNTVDI